jgi:hypothetical protein
VQVRQAGAGAQTQLGSKAWLDCPLFHPGLQVICNTRKYLHPVQVCKHLVRKWQQHIAVGALSQLGKSRGLASNVAQVSGNAELRSCHVAVLEIFGWVHSTEAALADFPKGGCRPAAVLCYPHFCLLRTVLRNLFGRHSGLGHVSL